MATIVAACSAGSAGGPAGPSMPETSIDPGRAAELRAHVDDAFFQVWLPGLLGNQEDARPIHALAHAVSEDLESGDADLFRKSLLAMPAALERYRQLPGHPARDRTILSAIEICVQEMLSILDGTPNGSERLSEDSG